MEDRMATEAHESIDADGVDPAEDEKSRWPEVAAHRQGPKRRDHRRVGGGPVTETRKQSGERPDGHARAA
jgi:hypothetical protein